MSGDFFFYGTLCHPALRDIVLGRSVAAEAAVMADHRLYWAKGGSFPLIVPEAGQSTAGVLLRGLSAEEMARLDLYDGGFGYHAQPKQVLAADGRPTVAMVYYPEPDSWPAGPGAPWDMEVWRKRYAAEFEATTRDLIALHGTKPPRMLVARFGQMMARGASRVRASVSAPTALRHRAEPGDVQVEARREPYARFFAMEEADLCFRRFDGSLSPKVTRAAFVACDAVTVMPYDPMRDRVLVVDQFRAGPLARGDAQPWQIEAIAGRIDPGETPQEAARREAGEEAGLALDALLPVAQYYPSPGCSAEFLYSFVALTDLPDDAAGVFGVEGEAEDIRGHVIGFDRLMELISSGEISNAPTILTAFWLAQQRAQLRQASVPGLMTVGRSKGEPGPGAVPG